MSTATVFVRPLEASDLDAIATIDEKLTGQPRLDYWRRRLVRRGFYHGAMIQLECRLG